MDISPANCLNSEKFPLPRPLFLKLVPPTPHVTSLEAVSEIPMRHPLQEIPGPPRGAVTEMAGALGGGKTEVLLRFLGSRPDWKVAWVEKQLSFYPRALLDHRISPDRVVFIESDPLAVAHRILRTSVFQAIVLSDVRCDEIALRRLQLLARRSRTAVILLQPELTRQGSWPISLQMDVSRDPSGEPRAQLLRVPVAEQPTLSTWETLGA